MSVFKDSDVIRRKIEPITCSTPVIGAGMCGEERQSCASLCLYWSIAMNEVGHRYSPCKLLLKFQC